MMVVVLDEEPPPEQPEGNVVTIHRRNPFLRCVVFESEGYCQCRF